MKDQTQIKVVTDHKFCQDEPDYTIHFDETTKTMKNLAENCSAGQDNHTDANLINEVFRRFPDQLVNCLDLGCAGGSLILDMNQQSSAGICIGLDGSMGVYKHVNWHIESNLQVLRHANLTQPFRIEHENAAVKFQVITCWEVIEHFHLEQLDTFFRNVSSHLSPNGIFFGSIALFGDVRDANGFCPNSANYNPSLPQFRLHKTVYDSSDKWDAILSNYFSVSSYPFNVRLRNHVNSYYFLCLPK